MICAGKNADCGSSAIARAHKLEVGPEEPGDSHPIGGKDSRTVGDSGGCVLSLT